MKEGAQLAGFAVIDDFSVCLPIGTEPEGVVLYLQVYAKEVFTKLDIRLEPGAHIDPLYLGKVPKGVTVTSDDVRYELVITDWKKYGADQFEYILELRQY